MRALSAALLLVRRVPTEAGMLLLLFALVALTSFLLAAAPRVFNQVTDDAVRYAVAKGASAERNVLLNATGTISPGSDAGVAAVQQYGHLREPDLPPSIAQLVSDRFMGITSVRLAVRQSIVSVSLRYQDGAADATRLVSGRWPVDRGMPLRQVKLGQELESGAEDNPTVFEIALSTTAANVIDAQVGDRLSVGPDRGDRLIPPSVYGIAPTEIEVVGLFEPLDPNADEWAGTGLIDPTFKQGPSGIEAIYATGLIAPEAYPSLQAGNLPFHYDWGFQIDPARLDADQVAGLQLDLQRLGLLTSAKDDRFLGNLSSVVALRNVSFGSGLPGIFDRYAAQRDRSESVLFIAALGPIGLAAGAIAMLAILLVRRRRATLLLARGRGASGSQLLAVEFWEATLLAGSASLLGLLLAINVVPARDAPLSTMLAIGVTVGGVLLLLAATWPSARRPLIQLERDDPAVFRVSPRRLVIEATIVGITLMAIVLLRQRGLTLGLGGEAATSDPLLAAVPLLCGLAAGIILMRLYPLPVRGLSWLASRRRDFVPVVGLRTVARHPASANLPLLVLMLTAAFAAFSSVIATSIDRGQIAASYIDVGSDYRLEPIGIGSLSAALDPSTVPGVDAFAAGVEDPRAAFVSASKQPAAIRLDAVDAPAYAKVTAATAADPQFPSSFLAQPSVASAGTEASPIPAIVSQDFPPGPDDLGVGDTFTVQLGERQMIFRLVQRRENLPGLGPANFAMVPLEWLEAAAPEANLVPTIMWVRGSNEAAGSLATMVSDTPTPTDVRIVSRQDVYGLVHDAPLGSAVADGFGAALNVAVLYLAITLVGAVIMSAAGRTRDLAYLRTLGVSTRQAVALTAVEHAPPVLLALIPGVILGVVVALVVEPGLGLADFMGAQGIPLVIDWRRLLLVILGLSAVVVVAIGLGTWLAARARLAGALRAEDG